MNTSHYRDKYAKQPDRNGRQRYRPGGEDVYKLCRAIERLRMLVHRLQPLVDTRAQNEIETKLWEIENEL